MDEPHVVRAGTRREIVEPARLAVCEPSVATRCDDRHRPLRGDRERRRIEDGRTGAKEQRRYNRPVRRPGEPPRCARELGAGEWREGVRIELHDRRILRARDVDRIARRDDADRLAADHRCGHRHGDRIDRVDLAIPLAGDEEPCFFQNVRTSRD